MSESHSSNGILPLFQTSRIKRSDFSRASPRGLKKMRVVSKNWPSHALATECSTPVPLLLGGGSSDIFQGLLTLESPNWRATSQTDLRSVQPKVKSLPNRLSIPILFRFTVGSLSSAGGTHKFLGCNLKQLLYSSLKLLWSISFHGSS